MPSHQGPGGVRRGSGTVLFGFSKNDKHIFGQQFVQNGKVPKCFFLEILLESYD